MESTVFLLELILLHLKSMSSASADITDLYFSFPHAPMLYERYGRLTVSQENRPERGGGGAVWNSVGGCMSWFQHGTHKHNAVFWLQVTFTVFLGIKVFKIEIFYTNSSLYGAQHRMFFQFSLFLPAVTARFTRDDE